MLVQNVQFEIYKYLQTFHTNKIIPEYYKIPQQKNLSC